LPSHTEHSFSSLINDGEIRQTLCGHVTKS
jgi:hypothetical protein